MRKIFNKQNNTYSPSGDTNSANKNIPDEKEEHKTLYKPATWPMFPVPFLPFLLCSRLPPFPFPLPICQSPSDHRGLWLSLSADLVFLLDPFIFFFSPPFTAAILKLLSYLKLQLLLLASLSLEHITWPTYHATCPLSHLMYHQIPAPTYQVPGKP